MKDKRLPRAEVLELLSIPPEALKDLQKEILEYNKDYFPCPRIGPLYAIGAVHMLQQAVKNDPGLMVPRDGDCIIKGIVMLPHPPNEKYVYIRGQQIIGKGLVSIPGNLKKQYRKEGKKLRVRHVEGRVYQLVRS